VVCINTENMINYKYYNIVGLQSGMDARGDFETASFIGEHFF